MAAMPDPLNPMPPISAISDLHPSRRDFLWRLGGGLGGIALASMLDDEGLLAGETALSRPQAWSAKEVPMDTMKVT